MWRQEADAGGRVPSGRCSLQGVVPTEQPQVPLRTPTVQIEIRDLLFGQALTGIVPEPRGTLRTALVVTTIAAFALACDQPTGPGRGQIFANRVNLERAKAKWAAAGVQDYAYEAQWAGAWIRTTTVRVAVSRGTVDSVIGLTPGQPLTPWEEYSLGWTIDELFGMIAERVALQGDHSTMTYDSHLGYPTQAALDGRHADDEVWFNVTLVRP